MKTAEEVATEILGIVKHLDTIHPEQIGMAADHLVAYAEAVRVRQMLVDVSHLDEKEKKARAEALEEAAKVCFDARPVDQDTEFLKDKATICANLGLAILALKDKP